MKNKGFTLIELLVLIAIIGILGTVLLKSINSARCKSGNLDISKCEGIEVTKKVTSTSNIADKFDRTKKTDQVIIEENNQEDCGCSNIDVLSIKTDCQSECIKDKNIQNCIERYSN